MSLKFKRHYPIVILLTVILAILVFAVGDQKIIAYSMQTEDQRVEYVASIELPELYVSQYTGDIQ